MAAYPNYYQYQPYGQYYPVYQQQMPATPQIQTQPQATQNVAQNQIQNGGFVSVRSEEEARSFPVALGTSVTFKHETEPYCYTKTRGFSQFETPRFEKFRLVKEEESSEPQSQTSEKTDTYLKKEDLDSIKDDVANIEKLVSSIKSDVDSMKTDMYGIAGKKKPVKKAEVEDDS